MARQVLKDGLGGILEKSVPVLLRVWAEMGMSAENQMARSGVVVQHINNLLEEMIREEKALHARLLDNIKQFDVEVEEISRALNLPKFEVRPIDFCLYWINYCERKAVKQDCLHMLLSNEHNINKEQF